MQRRVNILIPQACPSCGTEFVVTLDEVDGEETVRCTRCRLEVRLSPDSLGTPRETLEEQTPRAFYL